MSIEQEVKEECDRQLEKWGVQNHKNGTGFQVYKDLANDCKKICDLRNKHSMERWNYILLEEVYEALAEEDPEKLRKELIQCAAVIHTWIACIDRRSTIGSV